MAELNTMRLKASTLTEVLVAMVIVMLTMALSAMVFSSSMRGLGGSTRFQAEVDVRSWMAETRMNPDWSQTARERIAYSLVRQMEPWNAEPSLWLVTIEAQNSDGRVIASSTEVVGVYL